jgi:hypothetical protein
MMAEREPRGSARLTTHRSAATRPVIVIETKQRRTLSSIGVSERLAGAYR